jgi:agmatinase
MAEYRRDPQAALSKIVGLANGHRTYLSIDIDVVDPAFAPGTGTPEPGGMESWAILDAVYYLMSNMDVRALDVMEVLPSRDHQTLTAKLANRIITTALSTIDVSE